MKGERFEIWGGKVPAPDKMYGLLGDDNAGEGRNVAGVTIEVLNFVGDYIVYSFVRYTNHVILIVDVGLQLAIDLRCV